MTPPEAPDCNRDAPASFAAPSCSDQRTRDMENLRITIKLRKRQNRLQELFVARRYLRNLKTRNGQPLRPNDIAQRRETGSTTNP